MHKFFSAVDGRLVARFGTPAYIGARLTPAGVEFNPGLVVALTRAEWDRYGATYAKHVRAGDLRERTKEEFEAYLRAEEEAEAQKVTAPQQAPQGAQEGES